jgi:hypothetical protein
MRTGNQNQISVILMYLVQWKCRDNQTCHNYEYEYRPRRRETPPPSHLKTDKLSRLRRY